MIKRTLAISLLAAAILAGPVLAQGSPALSSLAILIWPEFDRPDALVIYQGRLAEGTLRPTPLEFRIPARVGEPTAVTFGPEDLEVAIHGHCHGKALGDAGVLPRLASRIPGVRAHLLDVGCCGMAGAFGLLRDTAALSRSVAEPLVAAIGALPTDAVVVASGTSCRHQIADLTDARPIHMAELLAEHIVR